MLSRAAFLDNRQCAIGVGVTSTGAIAQLARRVCPARRACVFLVLSRLEVIGVTGGAIRTIGRELPWNGLRVRFVATAAIHAPTMISVSRRGMPECDWRPAGSSVTGLAGLGRYKMP